MNNFNHKGLGPNTGDKGMAVEWESIGALGGLISAAGAGIYAGWQKVKSTRANSAVKEAESGAATSRAEASGAVFDMVKQQLADVQTRLAQAEYRIDQLREQIADRDNKIHSLEMHIRDLEHTMRQHGLEPPARPS